MGVPAALMLSIDKPFKVACVAQNKKAGVSKGPCAVLMHPVRALPDKPVTLNSGEEEGKGIGLGGWIVYTP